MSIDALSEHFDRSEFACKCHCGFDTVDAELLKWLEDIRTHFDRPVRITSGARCFPHNTNCGGSENSQHLYGRAADIVVDSVPSAIVAEYARQLGCGGVGEYDTFVHIDSRGGIARWEG